MKQYLLYFTLFISSAIFGQTVIEMPSGTNNNLRNNGCGDAIFTDSGGTTGNYANNESGTVTFCPAIDTDRMVMDFSILDLAAGDTLTVYDGDSTAAPQLQVLSNTSGPPGIVTASASNPTGCLTFRFSSNGSGTRTGWEARRSCINPCQTITPNITTTPAIDPDGILRICQGTTVQFEGQANFSNDGTGATYEWDFNNGRGLNRGAVQSETFNQEGTYQVRFVVTDATGCSDRDLIDLLVQVSNDPDFSGTVADDDEICLGDSTTLRGMVETVEFVVTPAPPITGTTYLPDGNGVVYQTCIDVDSFSPGTVFSDPSDLISLFFNMEHSWADDLDMLLTAPNGSSIEILQTGRSGGEKFLGEPDQSDTPDPPGVGYTYFIREDAPATEVFQNALAALPIRTPLPEGSYFPTTSFSNFIGTNLNGQWCLTVTDNLPIDNGYIFEWGLNFDPALLPTDLSFEPSTVREGWLPDPTIISQNGNDITVMPTVVGTKCYTYEFEDSFGCVYQKEVCIEVNEIPNPNQPNDILVCDNVGNVTTLDLTQNNAVMLPGPAATGQTIAYYNSLVDAQNFANPITNPSSYPASNIPETIYTTIRTNSTGCFVIRDFEVSINQAVFNPVNDLLACDDPSNDGIEVFDLSAQESIILGSQNSTAVTITYHRSNSDALNDVNAIINPANYSNENSPTQTIYVRVENNADVNCFEIGTFNLRLGDNPVANAVQDYELCDDPSNDGRANFELQSKDTDILGSQNPADFQVRYYANLADANSRKNALNKANYQNTQNPQTIVARIESISNVDCYKTTTFQLIVNALPDIAAPSNLKQCDDPSGDGTEIFDLSTNESQLLNGIDPSTVTVTYHSSQVQANSGANALPINYANNQASRSIYARVQNNATGCFSTTSFLVVLDPVPAKTNVPLLEACDDNGDGISNFRLNDRADDIKNGQSNTSVSYYSSDVEALSGTNSLNPESYNSSQNTEVIFYRLSFNSTGCFTTGSFEIETIPPPVAGTPDIVLLCDPGGGTINYDLTQSSPQIQNGQANTTITYHNNQNDADVGRNQIGTTYEFTNDTTLFARLENNATGCYDTVPLQLQFGGLPEPQAPEVVVLCRDPFGQLVDGPATIDTGLNNTDYYFEWRFDGVLLPDENDATLVTEQQGNYEVTVFDVVTGCSSIDNTLIRLAGPPDLFTIDITSEPFAENQRIEITATGPDDYWFQLDGGLFQTNPVFEQVSPGVHDVTISERNGCGSITTEVFVFGYPKFFTPNADGFNDTWNVAGGDRLPSLTIYIFDRYGKLLKELSPTGTGWDGTFLGNPLPSADYWFKLIYTYDGGSGEKTGHFALKR